MPALGLEGQIPVIFLHCPDNNIIHAESWAPAGSKGGEGRERKGERKIDSQHNFVNLHLHETVAYNDSQTFCWNKQNYY